MKVTVRAVTESGETLRFKTKEVERDNIGMFVILEGGYVLSNYTLYKMKGNVLCGEKVETKQLTVKIDKVN